jgi:hypothetical protein
MYSFNYKTRQANKPLAGKRGFFFELMFEHEKPHQNQKVLMGKEVFR